MFRAGVVAHPEDWPHGGYQEIQHPRRRNVLIDYEALAHLSGFDDFGDFQAAHRDWVESSLSGNRIKRQACWTQSIAAGSRSYVEAIRNQMGGLATGRQIQSGHEGFELREYPQAYNLIFGAENEVIGGENRCFLDI